MFQHFAVDKFIHELRSHMDNHELGRYECLRAIKVIVLALVTKMAVASEY